MSIQDLVQQTNAYTTALAAAVIGSTGDAVIGHDALGLITMWNTGAERILGATADEVLGQSFERFIDPVAREGWPLLMRRVGGGERIEVPSLRLRRIDGLAVSGAACLLPLRDRGDGIGFCLVIRDRSEAATAQETLAAVEERIRHTESLSSTGSFVIDAAQRTEQWSEGMYPIHGVSVTDFGHTVASHLELVHPEDRPAVSDAIEVVLSEGAVVELDHRLAAGDDRWVFLGAAPVFDAAGDVVGVIGACQDISARNAAEALKDSFLSMVSHELRTPLTSIVGYAGLIMKTHVGDDDLAKLVVPIERNGIGMLRMVEQLLDLCRLQAGQIAWNPKELDVRGMVRACMSRVMLPGQQVQLDNEVREGLVVVADSDALERVLGNLIGNACRYAGDGLVVVSAEREPGGTMLISVTDNGPGIAKEHMDRLFERFFQVPGPSAHRGTGLGLSIVWEYVSRLGGTVWCESEIGAGSRFFVRLP